MVANVKQYVCDLCKKQVTEDQIKADEKWALNTEVGDLCPRCARSWEGFKQSFIEKMAIENGGNVV